jgi:hypothetical protein
MPAIPVAKYEFVPFPTETDDGDPRVLLAKVADVKVDKDSFKPDDPNAFRFTVEFRFLDEDVLDRPYWYGGGLVLPDVEAKKVTKLAADPENYQLGDEDYSSEKLLTLKDRVVRIQFGDVRKKKMGKNAGEPTQDVVSLKPAKKAKSAAPVNGKKAPAKATKAKATKAKAKKLSL